MRPAHRQTRLALAAILAAGALGALVGCAGSGGGGGGAESGMRDAANPGDRGRGIGLEVACWIVDDTPGRDDPRSGVSTRLATEGTVPLVEALTGYMGRPVPLPEETKRAWRDNGFRVIAVPVADIDRIRGRLRLVGPVYQQWLGEVTTWSEAVKGPAWKGHQFLQMDNGPLRLDSGALRMLARAWLAPGNGGSAPALQVQLLPQHQDVFRAQAEAISLSSPTPRAGRESQGLVFSRLLLETALDGSDALVIVPESPGVDWSDPAPPPVEPDVADAEVPRDLSPPVLIDTAGIGPPIPSAPSIGEVMLTDLTSDARRGARIILVIIPNVPRGFDAVAR
jgi:hypothetical protein